MSAKKKLLAQSRKGRQMRKEQRHDIESDRNKLFLLFSFACLASFAALREAFAFDLKIKSSFPA